MKRTYSKFSINLRKALTGGIVLAIILTVAAVNIVFAIISYRNAQDATGQVYENLSYKVANFYHQSVEAAQKKLSAFSQIPSIADPAVSIDERVAVLRAVSAAIGNNTRVVVTDIEGKELVLSGEAEIDLSNRAYIQAALSGNKFITPPFFSTVDKFMRIVIAQPLKWNNEIVGAIFMLLPGDFLNTGIEAVKAGYAGYACAFDSNGALISHHDIIGMVEREENNYIEMAKRNKSYESMAETVETMLTRKNGTLIFKNSENERMLGGFSTTQEGWVVLVCSTISDVLTDTNQAIRDAIIASIICMLVAAVIAFVLTGKIIKPILMMTQFMKKAGSTGDIILNKEDSEIIEKFSEINNEIGELVRSIDSFIRHIVNMARGVKAISGGDLTVEVAVLSDKDVIGKSLVHLIDNLNSKFIEINASTNQVFTGSKQIADGAQSLAQGSVEQTSTIEELSDSIAAIAERTKFNANLAEEAVKNADVMRKVINVIDDIASQTNIISLNASVEAARAGQNGNAFAVVAEEVRSLAQKSAKRLGDIESGINESTRLINEIAMASKEQSLNISQINTGIEQVSRVVHQNSATSEESAAASEQMSAQARMLQELVSQFKLKA